MHVLVEFYGEVMFGARPFPSGMTKGALCTFMGLMVLSLLRVTE